MFKSAFPVYLLQISFSVIKFVILCWNSSFNSALHLLFHKLLPKETNTLAGSFSILWLWPGKLTTAFYISHFLLKTRHYGFHILQYSLVHWLLHPKTQKTNKQVIYCHTFYIQTNSKYCWFYLRKITPFPFLETTAPMLISISLRQPNLLCQFQHNCSKTYTTHCWYYLSKTKTWLYHFST